MKILAIESTCDETAAAVVENCGAGVKVISDVIASSVLIHQKYGGIVPEVAAREQVQSIVPVITEAVCGVKDDVQAVAVSYGPGLMGSLLIGVETAKTLAWAWKKPLYSVNHMAAHVFANWIVSDSKTDVPMFPAVGLVVSGGHTDLIFMKNLRDWEWIGGTRDDAVGEAFDKVARLLGFAYPGGPEIQSASEKITEIQKKTSTYKLPRPLLKDLSLEMSFSGLKAAVARMVSEVETLDDDTKNLIAWEFLEAVSEILVKKTMMAVEQYKPKSVLIAGGVAANTVLRSRLRETTEKVAGVKFFCPELKYCGDNAAMVGAVAILAPNEAKIRELRPEPGLATV